MIAQIDKQQAPVITLAVNPTRQSNCFANIIGSQFAAFVRSKRVHRALKPRDNLKTRRGATADLNRAVNRMEYAPLSRVEDAKPRQIRAFTAPWR
jgi:hypothetical protein